MKIYEKLEAVQQTLKAPKGQMNKFGGYKYRSCEDILEAVKPELGKVKASIILTDDVIVSGERHYIKATARFTDGEESVENSAFAREPDEKKGMDASQITGMASSYARKYALNGLLCIDDTKDADTMDNAEKPASPPKRTPEKPIPCSDCGNPITAHGDYQPNLIAAKTIGTYGAALCWDCAEKRRSK